MSGLRTWRERARVSQLELALHSFSFEPLFHQRSVFYANGRNRRERRQDVEMFFGEGRFVSRRIGIDKAEDGAFIDA